MTAILATELWGVAAPVFSPFSQIFTTPGALTGVTVPSGATSAVFSCWGTGGSGNSIAGASTLFYGGGGGGYTTITEAIDPSDWGKTITGTVGNGPLGVSAGAGNGVNGQASTLSVNLLAGNVVLSANGGQGGTTAGGIGGTATGGSTNTSGGNGTSSCTGSGGTGAGPGGALGGKNGGYSCTGKPSPGAGTSPGGGGGGSGNPTSAGWGSAYAGNGKIQIDWS